MSRPTAAVVLALAVVLPCLSACGRSQPPPLPEYAGDDWIHEPSPRFPERLSQTGLFSGAMPQQAARDVLAYEVRFPRFRDGLPSHRWIYVPPGQTIASGADGWQFPPNTVFAKTFYTDDPTTGEQRPLDTRLLRRTATGWQLAAYRWNVDGTDAVRLNGREDATLTVADGLHTVPKTLSCLACHQNPSGWVLGFTPLQLDLGGEGQQLAGLAGAGLFEKTPGPGKPLRARSELEAAVVGYWQGNCASCHRPGSVAFQTTELDLRYPGAVANTVDVAPRRLGTTDPDLRLVRPGRPDQSLLYILTTGAYPDPALVMPQLGTRTLDTEATALLRQWIESI